MKKYLEKFGSACVRGISRAQPVLIRVALVTLLLASAWQIVRPTTYRYPGGEISLRIIPSFNGGHLILPLGPLGELSWRTHRGPLNAEVRFSIAERSTALPEIGTLEDLGRGIIVRKLPWLMLFGVAIGFLLFPKSRSRLRLSLKAIGWSLASPALAILLVAVSIATVTPQPFENPTYRGPIKNAPRILRLLADIQRDWKQTEQNLTTLVSNLQRIQDSLQQPSPIPKRETTALLFVSDLHLLPPLPAHMQPSFQIVQHFFLENKALGIDAILDGGDLAGFGTDLEIELVRPFFESLSVPYIIVPGNHEDQPALDALAAMQNVVILDQNGPQDIVTIKGITILGAADPFGHSPILDVSPDSPWYAAYTKDLEASCRTLNERFAAVRPEILLVHNRDMGSCAADTAEAEDTPLVFAWGHLHQQTHRQSGSVTSVSPGTSGGNGVTPNTPYGFVLLEFDPDTPALVSVCSYLFNSPTSLREASCRYSSSAL